MRKRKRVLSLALAFALAAGSVSLPPMGTPHTAQAAEENDRSQFDYVTSGDGITIRRYGGMKDTVDLTAIFKDQNVVAIREEAFANNPYIVKVIIPKTVTTIGVNAFHGCGALTTVEFEEESQLKSIGAGAFAETNLGSIHIPGTVTSLGGGSKSYGDDGMGGKWGTKWDKSVCDLSGGCGTFYRCKSLSEVVFEEGTESLTLNSTQQIGLFEECTSLKSLDFTTRKITSLPRSVCRNDSSLAEVKLLDEVAGIGEYAFYGTAFGQTGFVFPASLTSIGNYAFRNSKIGGKIVFPETLQSIGKDAFRATNVTEATFPESVSIDEYGFFDCKALVSATFLGDAAFGKAFGSDDICTIYAYKDKGDNIRRICKEKGYRFNYLADSVEVAKKPNTTKYTYGDELITDGLELLVKAKNSDEKTTEDVEIKGTDLDSCQFSGYQPKAAGPQTVTVSYGKQEASFDVAVRYDLTEIYSSKVKKTYEYTGDPIVPEPADLEVVYEYPNKTVPSDCYTVTASNNVNAGGEAKYTITASDEDWAVNSYTEGRFEIKPRDLSDEGVAVAVDPESLTYNGGERTPEVSVTYTNPGGKALTLKEGTDYQIEYQRGSSYSSDVTNAGDVTVVVTGQGNYTGTKSASYRIDALDISAESAGIEIGVIEDQTYTGSAIVPELKIVHHKDNGEDYLLQKGTDYETVYSNNREIGTATVKVTGKGNYAGELSASFVIKPIDIDSERLSVTGLDDRTYTGDAVKLSMDLYWHDASSYEGKRLKEGTDYTYSLSGSAVDEDGKITGWGTVEVTIEGKGIYGGTATKKFRVAGNLYDAKIDEIPSQMYTGKEICPEPVVTYYGHALEKGKDYTVEYYHNTDEGTAEIVVQGIGDFAGGYYGASQTLNFTIYDPWSIENAKIEDIPNQNFTGEEIEPEVKIAFVDTDAVLKAGEDYTVTYQNNRNAGTAMVTVTGAGKYRGTKKAAFRILPATLTGATIKEIQDLTETGYELAPQITVTAADGTELTEDLDYTVSYEDNVKPGKATVTVTGRGNYSGTLTATFTILAKEPEEPEEPQQTQDPSQQGQTPGGQAPGAQTPGDQTPGISGQTQQTVQTPPSQDGTDAEEDDDSEDEDGSSLKKQKITVKVLTQKIKAAKVKKKAAAFNIKASAKGKITCKKVSGSKNLTISKTGKVKVKKKTKKGTYKIKVKITASEKGDYAKASVTKTIKVVIS